MSFYPVIDSPAKEEHLSYCLTMSQKVPDTLVTPTPVIQRYS